MNPPTEQLILITDLDGCLLNKHDYDSTPAIPVIKRLIELHVPIILSSSKTEAEMRPLATELSLPAAPLICENGGVVVWNGLSGKNECEVLGAQRTEILAHLASLKDTFRFESFADLGVDGVVTATDLPRDKAIAACDRHCTEPLRFPHADESIDQFRTAIESHGLTLTRGGRFWHVAGHTTKGAGMGRVLEEYTRLHGACHSIAIGDSPIDQSMLDIATFPIAIPAPDGKFLVSVGDNGLLADQPGSAGWATSVSTLLDRLT